MTHKEIVAQWFRRHWNEWHSVREVREVLALPDGAVRAACRSLHRDGFLIRSDDPAWRQRKETRRPSPSDRRTIGLSYRTKAGFMPSSRFAAMPLPSVIWLQDQAIVGPFCKHCGNPGHVHGPDGQCLNYRIHPVLPVGDPPMAVESTPPRPGESPQPALPPDLR
jgi:hypothetical protein